MRRLLPRLIWGVLSLGWVCVVLHAWKLFVPLKPTSVFECRNLEGPHVVIGPGIVRHVVGDNSYHPKAINDFDLRPGKVLNSWEFSEGDKFRGFVGTQHVAVLRDEILYLIDPTTGLSEDKCYYPAYDARAVCEGRRLLVRSKDDTRCFDRETGNCWIFRGEIQNNQDRWAIATPFKHDRTQPYRFHVMNLENGEILRSLPLPRNRKNFVSPNAKYVVSFDYSHPPVCVVYSVGTGKLLHQTTFPLQYIQHLDFIDDDETMQVFVMTSAGERVNLKWETATGRYIGDPFTPQQLHLVWPLENLNARGQQYSLGLVNRMRRLVGLPMTGRSFGQDQEFWLYNREGKWLGRLAPVKATAHLPKTRKPAANRLTDDFFGIRWIAMENDCGLLGSVARHPGAYVYYHSAEPQYPARMWCLATLPPFIPLAVVWWFRLRRSRVAQAFAALVQKVLGGHRSGSSELDEEDLLPAFIEVDPKFGDFGQFELQSSQNSRNAVEEVALLKKLLDAD
ncbi:MAG: hypothetical protein R3C18_17295 [Planctomycetaceae bacterium]